MVRHKGTLYHEVRVRVIFHIYQEHVIRNYEKEIRKIQNKVDNDHIRTIIWQYADDATFADNQLNGFLGEHDGASLQDARNYILPKILKKNWFDNG